MGLNIDKAYVGSSEVDKIYLGTNLVWQALEPGIPVEGAPNGVYILHTNGTLYTREQWKTSYNQDAVGVALVSDNCKFVIATIESENGIIWSESSELVANVTTASAKSEAIKDYNGINNTNALISKYGDSIDYAAGWCNNHTFKNGSKGYLGALGEWMEVFNNISDINQCITLIDATEIETTSDTHGYYTSTQFNASRAWCFNFKSEDSVANTKSMYAYVRPFATLT